MKNTPIPFGLIAGVVLISLCPATVLVDGVHGWTNQYDEPLESLFPNQDFDYLTGEDFVFEEILVSGVLADEDLTIPFTVPPGAEVLLLHCALSVSDEMSPNVSLLDPNGQWTTNLINSAGHVENPIPGEWQLFYNSSASWPSSVEFELGIGPQFFTLELLQQYDLMLRVVDNTYSFFNGYCPALSEYELDQVNQYLTSGGGYLLIRETDASMAEKPVIRLYAAVPTILDLTLDFPGYPTYMHPSADYERSNEGYDINWSGIYVDPAEYTELLYEGRPKAPLNFLTATMSGNGVTVTNRSAVQLGGLHLIRWTGSRFQYGYAEQSAAHSQQDIALPHSFSALECYSHLQEQLHAEGMQAGFTQPEMDQFWDGYHWLERWLSLATISGGICAITSFQGEEYDRFIALDASQKPVETVRMMWLFADNLQPELADPPMAFPFTALPADPQDSREGLILHEYGVVEERYPGPDGQGREITFFDLYCEDCLIRDETNNISGNIWQPLFHTFGEHEVAQLLTAGVNQIQGLMASPIAISDPTTQIPVVTGDDDSHCTGDVYPIGSYPAVAVAREIGDGHLLVINDHNIMEDNADNRQFLANALDWLGSTPLNQGDLNQDGMINVQDIVVMVNIITGYLEPGPFEQWAGDLNGDGNLNVMDVVLIINVIIGPQEND